MENKFSNIEKSNCHIHLTGALPPEKLRRLAVASEIDLGFGEPLESHLDFDDPVLWAAAKEITSTRVGLSMAIDQVVQAERQAGVKHIELTLNTFGMMRRGLEVDDIIDCLETSAAKASEDGVRLLYKFGINRKDGPQSIDRVVDTFVACPPSLRHSIDLNGDERIFPTSDFVERLSELSKKGVPITVHAGEFPCNTESLRDALCIKPARIAHATAVVQDEGLLSSIRDQDIVVEITPISNIKRGVVSDEARHHVRRLLDSHVQIVLGSDDPGFFGSTMTDELASLEDMGLTEDDVLALNSEINERVAYGQ